MLSRTRVHLPFLLFAASLLGGCFDLSGDSTRGEEGRARFEISDGLCPGLGGDCDFDTRVAAGASTRVNVEVDRDDIGALDIVTDGPAVATVTSRDAETGRLGADVDVTGAGTVTVRLVGPDGEDIDRASFEAATPTVLRCGSQDRELEYAVDEEPETLEITLPMPADSSEISQRTALCGLEDDEGPLLSVREIEWEIVAGTEAIGISTGLFHTGEAVRGARVTITATAVGTATLVARWGGMERTYTITVTDPAS